MPPRFSYWTIIAGGLPTAFRALEREELMPTFTRLREKHPDAEMKWFARGKLWDSPEAVRADTEKRRAAPQGAPDRSRHRDRPAGPPRDREWRPGGEHKDPRQKFKDAKTAKNVAHRRQKFARKHGDDRFDRPPAPPASPPGPPKRDWDRPREGGKRDWDKSRDGGRPEWRGKPGGSSAPRRDWDRPREGAGRDRPPQREDSRPPYDRDRKAPPPAPPQRDRDKSRDGGRPEWRGKPGGSSAPRRDWDRPREGAGRDRPPQREDSRPPYDRDRKAPPPAPPQRDWDKSRDGGRPEWRGKPGGSSAPRRDWNRPREGEDRDRPPRRDDSRPPYDRDRKGPPPASAKRAWDKPREGGRPDWRNKPTGSAPPRREWSTPRDDSKRAWDKPREGGAVPPKREWDRSREGGRPFQRKGFERNQGTEEPQTPPRPRGPNREPRPSEAPKPSAPPRPNEPIVPPPGPPERGLVRRKPAAEGGRLNRNKRRP